MFRLALHSGLRQSTAHIPASSSSSCFMTTASLRLRVFAAGLCWVFWLFLSRQLFTTSGVRAVASQMLPMCCNTSSIFSLDSPSNRFVSAALLVFSFMRSCLKEAACTNTRGFAELRTASNFSGGLLLRNSSGSLP